jgi:pantoate--beta-alanine ligase
METIGHIEKWKELRDGLGQKSLGFVPTLGALHKGHLSLIQRSVRESDCTVVSIFLNPTQFDNANDLDTYPSNLKSDLQMLEEAGVDYVILPNYKQMYPDDYNYTVHEKTLSKKFCGQFREGHFDGVLTVVLKLLNIARAQRAYFGLKDFQQYLLIKHMAEAFFIPTDIIACQTIRESDGLALSSRNERLTPQNRLKAPEFYRILKESKDPAEAQKKLEGMGLKVEYVEEFENRRLGAAYFDDVRLIDNVEI